MSEKKTFAELVGERLFDVIYEKLDSSDKAELCGYEVDYDFGTPTHAQTSGQYEEAVEKIVSGAVKCMLDNYVVLIESELIEERAVLKREIEVCDVKIKLLRALYDIHTESEERLVNAFCNKEL